MRLVEYCSTNNLKFLVIFALFVLTTVSAIADNTTCSIKIGVLLPLTGPASLIGERSEQATRMALEELPETIRGRVKLEFEDTEMKPAIGFRGVQKLLSDPNVVGLTGFGSETVGASADFIERKQVPGIFVTPDRKPIKGKRYLYRHWVDGKDMREQITPLLNKSGLNRVSIIHSEIPAMTDFAEEFDSHANDSGLEITYQTNALPSEPDFRTPISAALKTKPDAFFFFLLPPQISIFMKQLRSLDQNIPVFTYINTENSKELLAADGAMEGIIYAGPQFKADFVSKFQERFVEYPEFAAGNLYDIVKIYAKILADGACTPKEFRAGISQLKDFSGALGTYGVEDQNDFRFPVHLKWIKEGKFHFFQE